MLTKFFFSLILFYVPLFSMDPKKLSTQTLKDQIARRQRWLAASEEDQKDIIHYFFSTPFQYRNKYVPGQIERRNACICGWRNTISRLETELAKRTDR